MANLPRARGFQNAIGLKFSYRVCREGQGVLRLLLIVARLKSFADFGRAYFCPLEYPVDARVNKDTTYCSLCLRLDPLRNCSRTRALREFVMNHASSMHKLGARKQLPSQYNVVYPPAIARRSGLFLRSADKTHLRQQIQPRAQLDLTPHERAQIADAQRILQPALHTRFIIFLAIRRLLCTRDRRGIGFPSTDGIEEVFTDLNVGWGGGGGARGELRDIGLDLGDLLCEGL